MADSKSTTLYRWFNEVWNNRNVAAIDELMADKATFYGIGDQGNLVGPQDFKPFYRKFLNDFPDFKVLVGDVSVQNDEESAILTIEVTNPVTGIKETFNSNASIKVDKGQITEARNDIDDRCYKMIKEAPARM